MIEYIKGELTELTPAMAVVEAAGVGYGLGITLNTYTALQKYGQGKEVKIYVHEQLVTGGRDDSFTLFGFSTKQERELYRLLITVNGVGGNTARMILSATTPGDLCNTISSGNEKMLKTVKGIIRTAWKKQGKTYTLQVEVPANTVAEVHIPTSHPSSVRENGSKVLGNKSFQILSKEKKELVLEVGSGSYSFTFPL